jgi:hypothetical protein
MAIEELRMLEPSSRDCLKAACSLVWLTPCKPQEEIL